MRGFTLVEILVVLLVLSILAATIVPQFGGSRAAAALRAAGRDLVSTLQLARSEAVTRRRVHRLRLDAPARRFWLEVRNDAGIFEPLTGSRGRLDACLRVEIRDAEVAPEETPLEAPLAGGFGAVSPDVVRFRPDGTADAREIVLRDPAGFRLLLAINPTTARVRLERLGRELAR